jgi:hypothetical protein
MKHGGQSFQIFRSDDEVWASKLNETDFFGAETRPDLHNDAKTARKKTYTGD